VALALSGKRELCGNLIAAVMGDVGVERLFFGEFFRCEPFALVKAEGLRPLAETWDLGGFRRLLARGDGYLREEATACGDAFAYSLAGPARGVRVEGSIAPSYWSREQIGEAAKLSGFRAETPDPRTVVAHSEGFYLAVKLSAPARFEVGEAEVRFEAPAPLAIAAAGARSSSAALSLAEEALRDPLALAGRRAEQLSAALARAPPPPARDRRVRELWRYCWYVLISNRCSVDHPALRKPFTMPSKYVFRHQWLWDSAFHAIVLSAYDAEVAEEELLNLFHAQKPDGRIPHEIFLSKAMCKAFWGVDDYSPWTTQPPVLAVAVERILERRFDEGFAKLAYEALARYDRWFSERRDADRDGLAAYIDYLESGWDDSVRWDGARERFALDPGRYRAAYPEARMAPVEAVDLNCLLYLQRALLSKLAPRFGGDAEAWRGLAERTAALVKGLMWDERTGFFYDVYEEDHSKVPVKTPAAFLTMFAGIAERDQAERLVEHLYSGFWTTFPLPTVSRDDPRYDPKGYWRGRSWINLAWFTYWGLVKYGFNSAARDLAARVVELMAEGPTCNENYNSATGEPLGAPDFGWSTLVLDVIADAARRGWI
jgi:putative isomerase